MHCRHLWHVQHTLSGPIVISSNAACRAPCGCTPTQGHACTPTGVAHLDGQLGLRIEARQQRAPLRGHRCRGTREVCSLCRLEDLLAHLGPWKAWQSSSTTLTSARGQGRGPPVGHGGPRNSCSCGEGDGCRVKQAGNRESAAASSRLGMPTSSTLVRNSPPAVPSTATMIAKTSGEDCLRPAGQHRAEHQIL